jgi:amino acid transporter
LIVQALCCALVILLGQLGSSVRSAYQMLVAMSIIINFVPYLFMFASLIRLQREPVEAGVVRVPGGKPVAMVLGAIGFVATVAVILASVVPDPAEPHKAFAVARIVGLSAALLGGGALLYWVGKRNQRSSGAVQS